MKRITRRATRSASPSQPQSSASPNFPNDVSGDKRKLAALETYVFPGLAWGVSLSASFSELLIIHYSPLLFSDSSKRPLKRRNKDEDAPIKVAITKMQAKADISSRITIFVRRVDL